MRIHWFIPKPFYYTLQQTAVCASKPNPFSPHLRLYTSFSHILFPPSLDSVQHLHIPISYSTEYNLLIKVSSMSNTDVAYAITLRAIGITTYPALFPAESNKIKSLVYIKIIIISNQIGNGISEVALVRWRFCL